MVEPERGERDASVGGERDGPPPWAVGVPMPLYSRRARQKDGNVIESAAMLRERQLWTTDTQ